MKCRYTTVGGGNEGHPCSRSATRFGLCSIHLQVEYGHFYGGYRVKVKSERCLNCGEPRSDAPVDFYCRAKPAARSLTGGAGRRRGLAADAPGKKEKAEEYERARAEGANRSFGGRARVIKARDRARDGTR
jgi:hypothetical protein